MGEERAGDSVRDSDGYPTEAGLNQIKIYSGDFYTENSKMDIEKLIELLQELWHFSDYLIRDGAELELHTGGWSGNEDVISALQPSLFWMLFWRKSERGGHYYFELPITKEGIA